MWTLAHAHGALLGLVHIAFGCCCRTALDSRGESSRVVGLKARASWCLIGASVLLPGGFFAGGMQIYGGDPGPGILLAPVGAACLLIAVFLVARAAASVEVTDGTTRQTGRR